MSEGWIEIKLGKACIVNPKIQDKSVIDENLDVQFVPMKLVDEVIDKIHLSQTRKFKDVQKKSYTYFENGDVIFAKVTPCMENGKIAVAKNLHNGIGYGSSEFHVFRCRNILSNQFLFFFLVRSNFRRDAQHAMTGAVGLRRVPKAYLENHTIPLPPLPEQRAIVSKIEQLFSELDNGVANLKAAKDKLEIYRQAVLKKAFEGELTKEWREELNPKEEERFMVAAEESLNYGREVRENDYSSNSLPQNWKQVKLSDVLQQTKEKFKPEKTESRFYIGLEHIKKGKGELTDQACIQKINKVKNVFKKGQILYGKLRPYLNKAYLAKESGVCSTDILVFEVSKEINPDFAVNLILGRGFVNDMSANTNGVNLPRVPTKYINNYPIPLPPLKEQHQIVREIESRLSLCDNILANIKEGLEKAEALRQSILKTAFEGKLLSESELEVCRQEADWEPAGELIERIKHDKAVKA